MADTTRTLDESRRHGRSDPRIWTLVLAWVRDEPDRVGQSARLTGTHVLGRGEGAPRLAFAWDRPDRRRRAPPLACAALSREQLHLSVEGDRVRVRNEGRRGLLVNGATAAEALLREGDVVEVDRVLLAVLVRREAWMSVAQVPSTPFGAADEHGIVGESLAAWTLRTKLHWCGRRSAPVLVTGASGSGKELAARALHAWSDRREGPFVARNATTLPEALIDAELFGHAADYPQKGMPARPGLVGAAEHGTLFLDEIAELPVQGQAHLLRLLDGERAYHRLGEKQARRADVRIVAATNRSIDELRHDLAPRFLLRVEVPSLADRVEDVALLIAALARRMVEEDAELADSLRGDAIPVEPEFIRAMLLHTFTHQVRELATLMWMALGERLERIALTDGVRARLELRAPTSAPAPQPSWEVVRETLEAHGGNRTRAAAALGISRYALLRMIKREGGSS